MRRPYWWARHASPLQSKQSAVASRRERLRNPVSNADRTAHAGAAEAAIARRVLGQILLMIVLGEIERRRVEDLGGDGIKAPRFELLFGHRLRLLRGFALRGRNHIVAGPLLRAGVCHLPHPPASGGELLRVCA